MSGENELKPCPICQKHGTANCADGFTIAHLDENQFAVCCDVNRGGCGCMSGFRGTRYEAILAWNYRATPPGYEMVPEGTMKAIAKALACFDDLTQQSSGVSGLHLNGDLALWDELLHGGQYESWTNDIHALGAILKARRATQKEAPNAQGSDRTHFNADDEDGF